MKQIILIYSEKVLQVFFGFFVTYLLVNYFTADDYGVYKYILSLVSLFLIFILLGLNVTNIRYIPEYLVKNQKEKINYQILFFLIIQVALTTLSFLVIWLLFKNNYVEISEKINFSLLLVLFGLATLKTYLGESLHIAFSERVRLTQIRILLYFIQFLILIFAVLVGQVTILELQHYLVLYAAIEVFLLITSVWTVHRRKIGTKNAYKTDLSHTYHYAAYNYGFSWSNFARDNAATILVVAYLYSFTEVAYYSVALLIPNMVRGFTPSKVFSGFLMPEFVKKYTVTKNEQDVFDGLNLIGKLNVLYLVPAILFSVFNYEYIVGIFFGEQYAEATYYLAWFLFINIALMAFFDLFMLCTNILNRPDLVFKVNLLSVSNIIFLYALYEIGTISIGVANFVSTLITVMVFWYATKSVWYNNINLYFSNYRLWLYVFILGTTLYFMSNLSPIIFLALSFVLTIFSMLLFLRTGFFSAEERNQIQHYFPTKIRFLL